MGQLLRTVRRIPFADEAHDLSAPQSIPPRVDGPHGQLAGPHFAVKAHAGPIVALNSWGLRPGVEEFAAWLVESTPPLASLALGLIRFSDNDWSRLISREIASAIGHVDRSTVLHIDAPCDPRPRTALWLEDAIHATEWPRVYALSGFPPTEWLHQLDELRERHRFTVCDIAWRGAPADESVAAACDGRFLLVELTRTNEADVKLFNGSRPALTANGCLILTSAGA